MAAARRVLLLARAIDAGKVIPQPAWNYFNTTGQIWMPEPAGSEGGAYFNRT